MKYSFKSAAKGLVSLLIIFGFVYYLYDHRDVLTLSFKASLYHFVILIFLILLSWAANCLQMILLLRMEGVRIGFLENMLIQTATLMGNYLPMRVGSIMRFRYYKKIHNLDYLKFGGILGLRIFILLTSTGLFGCIGVIGLAFSGMPFNVSLCMVFFCLAFIPVVFLLTPISNVLKRKNIFSGFLSDFLSSFITIRHHPTTVFRLIVLLFLQYLFLAARLYVSFDAVQVDLSGWMYMILAPTATVLSFVSLTPGNLAFREWVIGILSVAVGYDFSSGIFAGTVDRAVLVFTTFVFGTLSILYVVSRFRKVSS